MKNTLQFITGKVLDLIPKQALRDILFTENGVQLRGGKLLSKEAASKENRKVLLDTPLMARKNSRIQLKKFPKT